MKLSRICSDAPLPATLTTRSPRRHGIVGHSRAVTEMIRRIELVSAARTGKSIARLEDGVITLLQAYHWPGNIRQLEHAIERAVVLTTGAAITCDAVRIEPTGGTRATGVPSLNLRQNVEWIERETIRRALDLSTQKQHAAELLGISARALSYYLSKYPLIERRVPAPS